MKKPTHEQILNASGNGVIATDAFGVVIFANYMVRDLFGLDPEVISGCRISELLPLPAMAVAEALKTGKPVFGRHVQAEDRSMAMNVTLIRQDRQIKGTVCSFQPTELLEISVRELESHKNLNRQLNAIFESSSDGLWVCDGQGNVTNVNSASEKLNGIRSMEVVGKNVSELMADGLFDRSVTLEVLKTRRQVSMIQRIRRTGRTLLITGTPVFDESGKISMVVLSERDTTQLNTMREQLEQVRQVSEKFREEFAELSLLELKKQEIVTENPKMRQVLSLALKLAHLETSNILILGESGTGKGLLAKFIHKNSHRNGKPFVQINCAALPESLLEAELFGYEKGAFTGAREQGKAGLFELAQGGTLFLDEIGDLPLAVQAKLLKYLDDHEIMRLGSLKPTRIDCTVVAATNRDLEELAKGRLFRRDLFYRLNTFTIRIPPLRQRPDDVFELTRYFLDKYNGLYKTNKHISPVAVRALQSQMLPGNVRELESIIKKATIMSDKELVDEFVIATLGGIEGLCGSEPTPKGKDVLSEGIGRTEREIFEKAMKECKSTRELARYLGISQPTAVRKLKKHGLSSALMHKRIGLKFK